MKNTVLLSMGFSLMIGLNAIGQAQTTENQPAEKSYKAHYVPFKKHQKDQALNRPWQRSAQAAGQVGEKTHNPKVMAAVSPNENVIGETRYDLQTNQSVQNRTVLYPDNTVGAVWSMGFADSDFPDRGTGYNYFDGSSWGAFPSARIENKRCGWPSLCAFGEGELVVSHNGVNGLELSKRPTRGGGTWTQSFFAAPAGATGLSWPRTVTNGANHEQIHIISITEMVGNGGVIYNGMDGALLYSRSLDGGLTWDIHHAQLPGTDVNFYKGFNGDCYSFAEPKGDTLAFVAGDNFKDLFLMKSNDNGSSWTKTIIYNFPYPFFEEDHTMITDTIWTCDGSVAVQLDKEGKAQVFFGLMRVNNSDTTDDQTSYWPYTDGLAWWTEGDEAFTTMHVDSVYEKGHLVGWMQDLNANDTVIGEMVGYAKYELALTSMPNVCIDEQNDFYLLMSGTMENLNNDNQNYRHVLARKRDHATGLWGDFFDLTESLIHTYDDCVFPSLAPQTNGFIHYTYQADDEPGLAVRGDEDPYTDNRIIYGKALKAQFVGIEEDASVFLEGSYVSPNPARDMTTFSFALKTAGELKVSLMDINGRLIRSWNAGRFNDGNHVLQIPLNSAGQGVFMLKFDIGQQRICHKVVVM